MNRTERQAALADEAARHLEEVRRLVALPETGRKARAAARIAELDRLHQATAEPTAPRDARRAWARVVALWWELALTADSVARAEARRRADTGEPSEDLLGEARIGLYEAARRWQPSRGVGFNHVAGWWVRAALTRHLQTRSRLVRLPARVHEVRYRAGRARADIEATGQEPTPGRIAERAGCTAAELAYLQVSGFGVSMDEPTAGDQLLGETLSDDGWQPESDLDRHGEVVRVREGLRRLPPRVAQVVRRRAEGDLLRHIGLDLEVSRERVRQIEQEGLRLLAAELTREG